MQKAEYFYSRMNIAKGKQKGRNTTNGFFRNP